MVAKHFKDNTEVRGILESQSEESMGSSSSGDFEASHGVLRGEDNLIFRECLSGEVPVKHQRGVAVAFFSEVLEMFGGSRKYDHEFDLDESSVSLEIAEDEKEADAVSSYDESSTCDLEKNYPLVGGSGKGGLDAVVVAEDRQFGRRVAIKSLKTPEDVHARHAFFSEARITAYLEHPAIVPIHNVYVDHENIPHLAMKYVEGRSFRERMSALKKKYAPLSWYKICAVERWQRKLRIERFLRVCEAIEYAHNRNVLHRDLKPENIMVGRFGEIYVMNWGMAVIIPKGQDWVSTPVPGSARYIAPEVLRHRPYGRTADIYQLGLILYEVVFLRRAFPWRDRELVLERVEAGELAPMVHFFGCYIPKNLKRIVQRATALDPLDRYQNVRELSRDLRRYLKNEATSVEVFPKWSRFIRMLSRNSLLLVVLFFVACAVAGAGAMLNLKRQVQQKQVDEKEDDTLKRLYSSNMRTGIQVEREIVNVEDDLVALCREAGARLATLASANPNYHYYRGTEGCMEEPPGYGYQATLGKNASFRAFGWHVPPEKVEQIPNLDELLSTLYPMLPSFQKLLTDHFRIGKNGQRGAPVLDLTEERTPVISVVLGFYNDLLFAYPFEGHRDAEFKVTEQDWYRRAMEEPNGRPVWTGPFIDPTKKDRIMMGCSATVYNTAEDKIGVAIAMMELASVLNLYAQKLTDQPEVRAHYLVHVNGDIYATDQHDRRPVIRDGDIFYQSFPDAVVFDKMCLLQTGRIFTGENHETLYIFVKIAPLDCMYIEEIDFARALEMENPRRYGQEDTELSND